MWLKLFNKTWFGYCAAISAIFAATGLLKLFGEHINATTVALAFLLIILFVATAWGSRPAVVASLVGIICFNFSFSHRSEPLRSEILITGLLLWLL